MNRKSVLGIALAATLGAALDPASAQTIVEEWSSIATPAAPALKPVTVDPKTTALLMLDFMNQNCGKRQRCIASVPKVKALLAEARAKGMPVVYSLITNTTTSDVMTEVAPIAGEPAVLSGPNKFVRTELDMIKF
jgi:hypothetical protein